jgi:hypothetical protein
MSGLAAKCTVLRKITFSRLNRIVNGNELISQTGVSVVVVLEDVSLNDVKCPLR